MSDQLLLSLFILIFGAIIFVGQVVVMVKREHGWGEYSTRISGIIILITVGGCLVASGLSYEKTGPMITLLGTVAGFVFGSWTKEK